MWQTSLRLVRWYVSPKFYLNVIQEVGECVEDGMLTSEQTREKKQSKIEQSGMTNEELIRAQEELFKSAGEKYNAATSPGES